MEVKIRDYTFTVDDSHEAFWSRVKDGEWEPGLLDVVDRYVDDDTVVYDVGAFIGAATLYASRKAKQVFAFEPNPTAFRWLEKNVEENGCDNVAPVNKGVSARRGRVQLRRVAGAESPMNTFEGKPNEGNRGPEVELVDVKSLVEDATNSEDATFFKIDTEGHEYTFFSSASDYFRNTNSVVHLSTHSAFQSFLVDSSEGIHHGLFRRSHRLLKNLKLAWHLSKFNRIEDESGESVALWTGAMKGCIGHAFTKNGAVVLHA
jgi:FkbM family methyltransferase